VDKKILRGYWQAEAECGSFAVNAAYPYLSIMSADDMLYNGKPKTCPAK